jgi:hypothetical protein
MRDPNSSRSQNLNLQYGKITKDTKTERFLQKATKLAKDKIDLVPTFLSTQTFVSFVGFCKSFCLRVLYLSVL